MNKNIKNRKKFEKWLKNNQKFREELFEIDDNTYCLIENIFKENGVENGKNILIEFYGHLGQIYNKKIINEILVKKWEKLKV